MTEMSRHATWIYTRSHNDFMETTLAILVFQVLFPKIFAVSIGRRKGREIEGAIWVQITWNRRVRFPL